MIRLFSFFVLATAFLLPSAAFATTTPSSTPEGEFCECEYKLFGVQGGDACTEKSPPVSFRFDKDSAQTYKVISDAKYGGMFSKLDAKIQADPAKCQPYARGVLNERIFKKITTRTKEKVDRDWCSARKVQIGEQFESSGKVYAVNVKCVPRAATEAERKKDKEREAFQASTIKLTNPLAGNPNIPTFIGNVLGMIISISGALLLLAFLVGGFFLLISAGNPGRVQTGMKTILYATIGFFVVFGSYAIIQLFFSAF